MIKLILCSLAIMALSFGVSANCDFDNNKCPVKKEFQRFLTKKYKRLGQVPLSDPMDGIKYIDIAEASKFIDDENYIFIDTRPANYFTDCKIKNAVNYLFGVPKTSSNTLTKAIAKDFVDKGKILVFYCNSKQCYRGLNATIQAYAWGIPKDKIRWFGKGVVGMLKEGDRSLLAGSQCRKFKKSF